MPACLSVQRMQSLRHAERVVIKVGSSLLIKPDRGRVNQYWLSGLARDIATLREQGKGVCVVSSGAVGLGRDLLKLGGGPMRQPEKQAAAACGQMVLMRSWQEVFHEDDIRVAQILLTIEDSESRRRYLNARNTLNTLLEQGIVPIINENDTVAAAEIRVGDNDRLAARVAQMIGANTLILLSDVEGLYTSDPTSDPDSRFIPVVEDISEEIRAFAAPAATMTGTGGMITKVEAAAIATSSGCDTAIALGQVHRPLHALEQGARHTLFKAQTSPMTARKEWIAGSLSPVGTVYVDDGAVTALNAGNSLLPIGIVQLDGEFHRGDAVLMKQQDSDTVIGKGLVAYNSDEMAQLIGRHSQDIQDVLGYERGDVMIHRDDMVLQE